MRIHRIVWGIIAVLAAAGMLALFSLTSGAPDYQGRPLSAWLGDLVTHQPGVYENALKALQQMQPPPAPILVQRLQVQDTSFRRFLERFQFLRLESVQRMRIEAVQGLLALGPAADSVAPDLARLASNPELAPQIAAILSRMGPRAAPALVSAYTNSLRYNSNVPFPSSVRQQQARRDLTLAVGTMGTDAAGALPSLIQEAKSPDFHERNTAAIALGRIGAEDKRVQAALLARMTDTDETTRRNAARALGRLDRKRFRDASRSFRSPDYDPFQNGQSVPPVDAEVISALIKMAERDRSITHVTPPLILCSISLPGRHSKSFLAA